MMRVPTNNVSQHLTSRTSPRETPADVIQIAAPMATTATKHVEHFDVIERLLSAFIAGRSPHTVDAYQRDIADFGLYLRRVIVGESTNPVGKTNAHKELLRWFFAQRPGRANELVLHYRHDLLARGKSTSTTARHLSVIKPLPKYARMTGLITWAVETPSVRIEPVRDTRGRKLETT